MRHTHVQALVALADAAIVNAMTMGQLEKEPTVEWVVGQFPDTFNEMGLLVKEGALADKDIGKAASNAYYGLGQIAAGAWARSKGDKGDKFIDAVYDLEGAKAVIQEAHEEDTKVQKGAQQPKFEEVLDQLDLSGNLNGSCASRSA